MARLPDSERKKVGTLKHECGQVIPVYQSKRSHLYLNCPLCGIDQRNDAGTQSAWFRAMVPDAPFTRPRNVWPDETPIGAPEPKAAPEKPTEPAAPADDRPTSAAPEPFGDVTVQKPTENCTENAPIGESPKKPSAGGLIVLAVLASLSGVAMILSGSTSKNPVRM